MNTLFRVIDEPILASGVTAHVMVHYTYANDPTWQKSRKSPNLADNKTMIGSQDLICDTKAILASMSPVSNRGAKI